MRARSRFYDERGSVNEVREKGREKGSMGSEFRNRGTKEDHD